MTPHMSKYSYGENTGTSSQDSEAGKETYVLFAIINLKIGAIVVIAGASIAADNVANLQRSDAFIGIA